MDESALYRVLGIPREAGPEEIRRAYRKLVKQFHPDLSQNPATSEQFKRVVKAYKVLSVKVKQRSCIEFPVKETRETGPSWSYRTSGSGAGSRSSNGAASSTGNRTGSGGGAGTDRKKAESARREPNIPVLGNMALTSRAPEMRAFAVKQLGNSGKRSAYFYIRKALFDPAPLVVRSAVEAVATLKIRQSAGELSAVFSRSGTEIRLGVIKAISSIGLSESFVPIITLAMQDSNRAVRNMALELFAAGKGA